MNGVGNKAAGSFQRAALGPVGGAVRERVESSVWGPIRSGGRVLQLLLAAELAHLGAPGSRKNERKESTDQAGSRHHVRAPENCPAQLQSRDHLPWVPAVQ